MFTVCCLLLTVLTAPSFAASSKTLFADFEGLTALPSKTDSSYGISGWGMKKNNSGWESKTEIAKTKDAKGDDTDALHFYWHKPQTVAVTSEGNDPYISIDEAVYDQATVTAFDFKLDNNASNFIANYRIDGSPAQWIQFVSAQADSKFKLFNTEVNLDAEADVWYHVAIKTEYDANAGEVKGSAWVNGNLLADNKPLLTIEREKLESTKNILRFRSDYTSAASDINVPGIWLDNLTIDKVGSGTVATTPKNNASVTDGSVSFLFGADIDTSTLDISKIIVKKDGVKLDITPSFNYNRLTINVGEIEASDYIVTLPSGVKDIFGNEFSDDSLSVTFKGIAAERAEFKIVSPADGSVLTCGEPVVIKATAKPSESVDFYADETRINDKDVEADSNGVCTFNWTPSQYGDINLTVRTSDGSTLKTSDSVGVNVMNSEQKYIIGSPGSETYQGKENCVKIESEKSIDNPNLSITSGIYELVFDVYTDEKGTGADVGPIVSYTNGGDKKWWSMMKMSEGNVTVNNAKKATCTANSWHRVRMVFDMDAQTCSIYLNGEQLATGISLAESGKTAASLYRIKIGNGAKTSTVYYTTPKVNHLSEAITGVSVTSLTDGSALEKNQMIVLKATASGLDAESAEVTFYKDGKTIGKGEKQSDGSFKYSWTPSESGSAKISAVAEIGDVKYVSKEVKVNVLGDASTLLTAKKSLTVNSGEVTVNNVKTEENKFGMKTEDTVTMILTQGNNAPYTQMDISQAKSSGYFAVEADVTVESGGRLILQNRNSSSTNNKTMNILTLDNGNISVGNTTLSGASYKEGEKLHLKALLNLTDKKIDVYIDGVRIAGEIDFAKSDYEDIKMLRFGSYTVNKAVTVQNEAVRYIPPAPEISEISVKNADGNNLTALKASDIKSIYVTYDSELSALTTNSVKLYRGSGTEGEINVKVSLSTDQKTIIVDFAPAATLESSAMYRLVISGITSVDGAQAADVNYSFRTLNEGKGASNGVFMKGSDEISSPKDLKTGDKITFTADVTDDIAETNVWVVLAVYGSNESGKVIKDVSVTKNNLSGLSASVSGELTLTSNIADGDTVFAYVWDNDMIPFGDEFPLQASN